MNLKHKMLMAILAVTISMPIASAESFPSLEEMQALMNKAKQKAESPKTKKFKKLNDKQVSQLVVKSLVERVRAVPFEQMALLTTPNSARKPMPAITPRKRSS